MQMSRDELIGALMTRVGGHKKADEIMHILAVFATYKITNEIAEQHELTEYSAYELMDNISKWLRIGEFVDENRAWSAVIDSIGSDKIWHIINNPELYISKYLEIEHIIDSIKDKLYRLFALEI